MTDEMKLLTAFIVAQGYEIEERITHYNNGVKLELAENQAFHLYDPAFETITSSREYKVTKKHTNEDIHEQ